MPIYFLIHFISSFNCFASLLLASTVFNFFSRFCSSSFSCLAIFGRAAMNSGCSFTLYCLNIRSGYLRNLRANRLLLLQIPHPHSVHFGRSSRRYPFLPVVQEKFSSSPWSGNRHPHSTHWPAHSHPVFHEWFLSRKTNGSGLYQSAKNKSS